MLPDRLHHVKKKKASGEMHTQEITVQLQRFI